MSGSNALVLFVGGKCGEVIGNELGELGAEFISGNFALRRFLRFLGHATSRRSSQYTTAS